jgi:hypothetical protein
MQSPAITTIVKMIEALPEAAQNQDEAHWDGLFAKTGHKLAAAARQAKQEIAGKASPMDYDAL